MRSVGDAGEDDEEEPNGGREARSSR